MGHRTHAVADTIVACATAPGEGAVAIVRLSGPRALEVGRALAPAKRPRESHRLSVVKVVGRDGTLIDEAMICEMHAPRSYTGEDSVELHLHGSRSVVQSAIDEAQAHGARMAAPGEFTMRAFLNGRMDLAQAEAVGDLIAASGDTQRTVAADHLRGGLSRKVAELQHQLEGVVANAQAALDFPEEPTGEGLDPIDRRTVASVKEAVSTLIKNARMDLRRGRQICLCGAPNVGKSSLLNRWVGDERVIVDDQPGTTRDPVEVEFIDGLVRWSVFDTAGIRDEATGVERRGIDMTLERARSADLAIWLINPEAPVWPPEDLRVSIVGAKADLADQDLRADIESESAQRDRPFLGWVSSKSSEGVDALRRGVAAQLHTPVEAGATVVVRQRHTEALVSAMEALGRFDEAAQGGLSLDVLAIELEDAVRALGWILGRDVDTALLDRIFSEFCIGK